MGREFKVYFVEHFASNSSIGQSGNVFTWPLPDLIGQFWERHSRFGGIGEAVIIYFSAFGSDVGSATSSVEDRAGVCRSPSATLHNLGPMNFGALQQKINNFIDPRKISDQKIFALKHLLQKQLLESSKKGYSIIICFSITNWS